jgi:hypothetical protein
MELIGHSLLVSRKGYPHGIGLGSERPFSAMDLTTIRLGTSGIGKSVSFILSDRKLEREVYSFL